MALVIVVAAIGALVLLVSILALSRSRFVDESERFRYVSDLTSKWSRQQHSGGAAGMPASTYPQENDATSEKSIDLREVDRGARQS